MMSLKTHSLEKVDRMKPPHSYIALIATAILNSPEKKLTLTEINDYLVKHYVFFRGSYQGWKNSVRHNLSFNKCFVKILRDPARPWGKDNYWTVSSLNDYLLSDGTFRRRRRRKPKKRDVEASRGERLLQANHSGLETNLEDYEILRRGTHRSALFLPRLPPKDHRIEAILGQPSTSSAAKFRGSFSIENILSDQHADDRKSSTNHQSVLPSPEPAAVLGEPSEPTCPQRVPQQAAREGLVLVGRREVLPSLSHGCDTWNTYPQYVPHYCYCCH